MASSLEWMDTADLADTCRKETSKFFRNEESDSSYCWEMFHRALALESDHAWQILFELYGSLVRGWLRQCGGFESLDVPLDELETLSFEKFWHATAKRKTFSHFHSLPSILHYLRTCCTSVITDSLRLHVREKILTPIDDVTPFASSQIVEREVVEREEQQQFWRRVYSQTYNDDEVLLLQCYFILGLKPRQIHARYPSYFPDIQDVYRVKRNVLNRLRRSEELRARWRENA
ncbi:MAG: hypothetical protein M3220_09920 [Chloroflexota bacterium]|nr:hypothetical protein [Chloroflexota bacterium]